MPEGRIAYLCLQATVEGQASYAHVHEIIKGLERRGWRVALYEVDPVPSRTAWQKPVAFGRVQRRLCRDISQFDLLYVRSHVLAFPSVAWAKGKGVPVVQEINGPYEDLFIAYPAARRLARPLIGLSRLSRKMSDALIVVTPELKSWVQKEIGPKTVRVIPNAADTDLFRPDATLRLATPPRPYALFFGALAPWQGLDTLLQAVQHPRWPAEVALVLAGEGAMRPEVERAAASEPRIVFLGPLPYRDMPGLIANCLVSLIPKSGLGDRSQTGLSPLKVFESLACGVPVVATDFPGQADLIRDNNCGIVVPADDPAALAEAVAFVQAHPEKARQMGRRGRAVVEQDHSWDQRAGSTSRLLTSVIEQA